VLGDKDFYKGSDCIALPFFTSTLFTKKYSFSISYNFFYGIPLVVHGLDGKKSQERVSQVQEKSRAASCDLMPCYFLIIRSIGFTMSSESLKARRSRGFARVYCSGVGSLWIGER
jgi:hypothetical protein